MYLCDFIVSLIRNQFHWYQKYYTKRCSQSAKSMLLTTILDASVRDEVRRWFNDIWAGPKESRNLLCGKKWKRILVRVWAKPRGLINKTPKYLGPRVAGKSLILPLLQASNVPHVTLPLIRLKQKTISKGASETDFRGQSPVIQSKVDEKLGMSK